MKVNDVIQKYHRIVPFPWTIRKLSAAGFVPAHLFKDLGEELAKCTDIGTQLGQRTLAAISELEPERSKR